MLLILEIWLTVTAWRKGWKGLALLPCAAVFVVGIFLGASGMSQDEIMGCAIVADVLTCVVLGVMAANGRTLQPANESLVTRQPVPSEFAESFIQ